MAKVLNYTKKSLTRKKWLCKQELSTLAKKITECIFCMVYQWEKFPLTDLLKEIDEEILKIQTDLISEKDFQKLQNTFENQFVNANANVEGIAENLAKYHMLYGDINLINNEIDLYHSITREEIREVAKKYLNPNQRLILDYVPSTEQVQK